MEIISYFFWIQSQHGENFSIFVCLTFLFFFFFLVHNWVARFLCELLQFLVFAVMHYVMKICVIFSLNMKILIAGIDIFWHGCERFLQRRRRKLVTCDLGKRLFKDDGLGRGLIVGLKG